MACRRPIRSSRQIRKSRDPFIISDSIRIQFAMLQKFAIRQHHERVAVRLAPLKALLAIRKQLRYFDLQRCKIFITVTKIRVFNHFTKHRIFRILKIPRIRHPEYTRQISRRVNFPAVGRRTVPYDLLKLADSINDFRPIFVVDYNGFFKQPVSMKPVPGRHNDRRWILFR